jgi:hypothetical protein
VIGLGLAILVAIDVAVQCPFVDKFIKSVERAYYNYTVGSV